LLATNASKPPPTLPVAKPAKGKGAAKKNTLLSPPAPPPSPIPPTQPRKGRSLKNARRDDDKNKNNNNNNNNKEDEYAGFAMSQPRAGVRGMYNFSANFVSRADDDDDDDDEEEEDDNDDDNAVYRGRLYILTARNPLTRTPDISTYSYIDPDGHTVLMPRSLRGMSFLPYSTWSRLF
jgi:hypothetical protein